MLLSAICLTTPLASAQSTAPEKTPDAATIDMTGRWAQRQITTSISDIPILGDVVTTTTSVLMLDVVQKKDGKIAIKETICDIDINTDQGGLRTIIPPAFVRAASGTTRTGRVWKKGDRWGMRIKPKVVVLGAKLARPDRDALPDDEDDARLVDADRDGKPGLTVRVRGAIDGEIYIVQRGWNEMTGSIQGKDQASGTIRWKSEQSVVDSSSIMLSSSPETRPDKRASKNTFAMKRVAPGASCATVKALKF